MGQRTFSCSPITGRGLHPRIQISINFWISLLRQPEGSPLIKRPRCWLLAGKAHWNLGCTEMTEIQADKDGVLRMSPIGANEQFMYWVYETYSQKHSTAIKSSKRASKSSIYKNILVVIKQRITSFM